MSLINFWNWQFFSQCQMRSCPWGCSTTTPFCPLACSVKTHWKNKHPVDQLCVPWMFSAILHFSPITPQIGRMGGRRVHGLNPHILLCLGSLWAMYLKMHSHDLSAAASIDMEWSWGMSMLSIWQCKYACLVLQLHALSQHMRQGQEPWLGSMREWRKYRHTDTYMVALGPGGFL